MRQHRPALPIAVSALILAGTTACSGEQEPETTGDLAAVEVSRAEQGSAPTVEVPAPFAVETSVSEVREQGDGAQVAEGDVIGMEYVLVNGRTGNVLDESAWAEAPTSLVVDESILTGLRTELVGKPVGSEVLLAIAPQDGFEGASAPPAEGVEATDTLLFYVDLVSAVPPRATGEPVPPQPGLPAVALAEDGAPTITIPPGAAPPGELVVQPLITGTGAPVQVGQVIRVHYTGVKWADGSVFDSSWEAGTPAAFPIGQGRVIPGWDAGLVDQPVGSQVMLVVPPAEGYGDAGAPDAGISGTDTLVFVVDILAADSPAPAEPSAETPAPAESSTPAG